MTRSAGESLFKSLPHKDKAENTNSAARSIISQETKAREAKTARLKEARLAQEPVEVVPVVKKRRATKS